MEYLDQQAQEQQQFESAEIVISQDTSLEGAGTDNPKRRSALREKAARAKRYRCKTLIVVLENPANHQNIGTVIRNIDALGAGKLYVIDSQRKIPDTWQEMRQSTCLMSTSSSAVKWTYVRKFNSTAECLAHLGRKGFISVATSPHVKGRTNVQLEQADFTKYRQLAVWFGNEASGLTNEAITGCQACLQLNMCGIIESLNLVVCTGIIIAKNTKQRRKWFVDKQAKTSKNKNLPYGTVHIEL